MNHVKPMFRRPRVSMLMAVGLLCAGSAIAATVSMPTSEGQRDFETSSFASAVQASPTGEFACFSAGMLAACTPTSQDFGVLGADLGSGLTLGWNASVTLAMPASAAIGLSLWEAGTVTYGTSTYVAVRTAAGWSVEQAFGSPRMAAVQNDQRPSGYQTNFGSFSIAEFGLATGTVVDAVRIRSGDAAAAHLDILAVSLDPFTTPIPEPQTIALLLAGLLVVGLIVRHRRPGLGAAAK